MTAFVIENMAPIMFASLVVLLLLGYPVAFALAANGLVFAIIGIELGLFPPVFLQALPERIFGIMNNDTLLAIPFFTFMGLILERSGMAEDLLDTVGQLFGPVRGGLAFAVVLVGALLAATTGVVAASVIAMGLISLPIMLRYGYDRRVASGVIAASGTLAQIIPPSLVLIIMADQLGRSVGDMYEGAIIPGLVLTGLYMAYIGIIALRYPKATPALPIEARTLGGGVTSLFALVAFSIAAGYAFVAYSGYGASEKGIWSATASMAIAYAVALVNRGLGLGLLSRLAQQVIIVLMPPLALIFLVLGTIFLGIATPTEGGAMGAVGALLLAIVEEQAEFQPAAAGARRHHEAVSLRAVHLDRSAGLFADVLRRQRPYMGGASAALGAGWPARLPDRRQCSGLYPRFFPRLLRAGIHRGSAARAGRRQAGY